jgi:hypothetical protein
MRVSAVVVALLLASQGAQAAGWTDEEIVQFVIQDAIREYVKPCPCRYSLTPGSGMLCGESSAFALSGGKEPKCVPSTVTREDIDKKKAQLKLQQ